MHTNLLLVTVDHLLLYCSNIMICYEVSIQNSYPDIAILGMIFLYKKKKRISQISLTFLILPTLTLNSIISNNKDKKDY